MDKLYGGTKAEKLFKGNDKYILRKNLFEVYPHATILRCFTKDRVLPYKRKTGRSLAFIKEHLNILQDYISSVVIDFKKYDIQDTKSKDLKQIEDKLDSIICAYTLFICDKNGYNSYDDLLIVPKNL